MHHSISPLHELVPRSASSCPRRLQSAGLDRRRRPVHHLRTRRVWRAHHQLDSIRGRHRHHRGRAGRGVLALRARQPRAVFFPFGSAGAFGAAAIVYWSYTGFDMVATMTEEAKNPVRDVPLGLISSMLVVTLVYCAMPPGARGDAAVQRH